MKGYSSYVEESDLANLFDVDTVSNGEDVYYAYNLLGSVSFEGMDMQEQPLTYLVMEGDTWLGISYALYGDVRYWWVLAKLNGCTDATVDPEPGSTIYVLSDQNVHRVAAYLKQT